MNLRDIISPFYAWKRAFEKPFTIKKPVAERVGAPRYRGFHVNDLDKCVGCGTCEEICQNGAIDMVEVKGRAPAKGDSGLRPRIDYGRCCWCALCVEVCPTGCLGMSNEYNWLSTTGEDWVFTPGVDDTKWNNDTSGYRCADEAWLLDPDMRKMSVIEPETRKKTFDEMALGYGAEPALEEAVRCLECGLCVETCPTHMDVPEYIRAIREDRLDEGLRILYDTNPFSESCGRVCTARCQEACPLGHRGEPIAIRWLKRYITDNTIAQRYEILGIGRKRPGTGKRVAVIGGGPSGLTAAYYLRSYGHAVKVYEMHDRLGGMLLRGIPGYRLPDDVLQREMQVILDTGVEIEFNTRVGVDVSLKNISDEYDAVYVSVGAQKGSEMPIDGMDERGVHIGIDFLDRIAGGERPSLGERIAVVGGGNTAMDVCRTAVRLGAKDVHVLYRRTEHEMPAHADEIAEAREEGVNLSFLVTPVRIARKNGALEIECLRMELGEPDESGRRRPVPIEGSEFTVEADACIMAIGQQISGDMAGQAGVKVTRWGTFEADRETLATSAEGIFAGGDCETGPDDAIRAVASGKKAAYFINEYLSKEPK